MLKLFCGRTCWVKFTRHSTSVAAFGNDRQLKPKSKEFYDEAARQRNYFYIIDLKGQLFMEDCKFRNFTTCLKDPKFLSFFYKNLKVNDGNRPLADTDQVQQLDSYHHVSPCGKEMNFVTHEDLHSALGFVGLEETGDSAELIYPGNIGKEQLNPTELTFSSTTGRLYHTITVLPGLRGCQGLLHPSLCQILGNLITHDIDSDQYNFQWQGQSHKLKTIQ